MDPLSIAASACGIAALCGTIVQNVGRFIVDANESHDTVSEFKNSISALGTVLKSVQSALDSRKQQPFVLEQERKHWQEIGNVLRDCNSCLYKLTKKLPALQNENPGPLERARVQFAMSLKQNIVVQINGQIASYTRILQLTLTSVSLGSIWDNQKSTAELTHKVEDLTAEIRSSATLFQNTQLLEGRGHYTSPVGGDPEEDTALQNMLTSQRVSAWRESALDFAAAVTLYEPDDESIRDRSENVSRADRISLWRRNNHFEQGPGPSDAGDWQVVSDTRSGIEHDDADSDFDPDESREDIFNLDIQQCLIAANTATVKRLLESGLYPFAEGYLLRGIEMREHLEQTHQVPFSDRQETEELLADILMKQQTTEGFTKANAKIKELLSKQAASDNDSRDTKEREWRLYHRLSESYLKLGKTTAAKKFAQRALNGRQSLDPVAPDQIQDTARLLIRICKEREEIDVAAGLEMWLGQAFPVIAPPLDKEEEEDNDLDSDVFAWCKERGFDVQNLAYRVFDQTNSDGRTPLHIAVAEKKLKIVEQIVGHVVTSLEARDPEQCTAILLAASTRNRHITRLLLQKKANTNVVDRHLNTPLHRAQFAEGGVNVAQLILEHPSRTFSIDQRNSHDETALHLACQYGNEKMVDLLLKHRADVNCLGLAKLTPLHIAIEYRRAPIVRKLLEHGADISLRDGLERDAVKAAETAHSPSPEIKRLLQEHRAAQNRHRRESNNSSIMPRRDTLFSQLSLTSSGSDSGVSSGPGILRSTKTWTQQRLGFRKNEVEHIEIV